MTSCLKCYVDHSHTVYSSGNIDVRNWVHLFESRCIFKENRIFVRCHVCLILCNVCSLFIRFLSSYAVCNRKRALTLIMLMWRIWWASNQASKWQMGFNTAFKGLTDMRVCLRAIGALYMSLTFPLLNVVYMNKLRFVHFCFCCWAPSVRHLEM